MKKTNKVEFLERQFHSEKLSFVRKKESKHLLEISLSTCVFYRCIFNLEMENFSLENHHMMNARQPFCWRITSTKSVKFAGFFPTPYVVAHLTFVVGRGGGYGWFSLGKNFFPKPLELDIFSLTYNGVRFFFSVIYVIREIFLSAGYYFSQVYPCKFFPPRNQSSGYFFLKSSITSSKVAKIHQTLAQ